MVGWWWAVVVVRRALFLVFDTIILFVFHKIQIFNL